MTTVKLLSSIAGNDFSAAAGDEFETSPEEAQRLIAAGVAEPIDAKPAAKGTKAKPEKD